MLVEPVGELLQGEANILEADFLADDVERVVGVAVPHRSHDSGEDRSIADTGIEQPQRWRARVDVGEFLRNTVSDDLLFAAGVDEQKVLLAVVEEAEAVLSVAFRRALNRRLERQL